MNAIKHGNENIMLNGYTHVKDVSTNRERINYIDISKGIAILMIIDTHFFNGGLFQLGETFHVVTFFAVAGILSYFKNEERLTIREIIYKKAKGAIYPYITLNILYLLVIPCFRMLTQKPDVDVFFFNQLYKFLSLLGIGTLWFFPVFFFASILFLFIKKGFPKSLGTIISIIISIIALILSGLLTKAGIFGIKAYSTTDTYGILLFNPASIIISSCIASGFVLFGYYIGMAIKRFRLTNMRVIYLVGFCIAMLVVDALLHHNNYSNDLHKASMNTPVLYLLCSISGILFVLSLSIIIQHILIVRDIFLWLGNNSIILMTTHLEYYVVTVATYITYNYLKIGWTQQYILSCTIIYIIIFSIEFVAISTINKTKLKYLYRPPIAIDNKLRQIICGEQ